MGVIEIISSVSKEFPVPYTRDKRLWSEVDHAHERAQAAFDRIAEAAKSSDAELARLRELLKEYDRSHRTTDRS